ncbi:MAG: NUMOD4 domain-containing protein [Bacteroidia bacterium]
MAKQKIKKIIENISKEFENEEWKKIDFGNNNVPVYEVSNYGRIKSYAYKKYPQGRIINGSCVNGYRILNVHMENGETQSKYIHKLVAEFFVKKTHKYQTYVIHKDHNKLNNHFENLIWATREELDEHNKKNPVKRGRKPGQKNNDANTAISVNKTIKKLSKLRMQLQMVLNEIKDIEQALQQLTIKR